MNICKSESEEAGRDNFAARLFLCDAKQEHQKNQSTDQALSLTKIVKLVLKSHVKPTICTFHQKDQQQISNFVFFLDSDC